MKLNLAVGIGLAVAGGVLLAMGFQAREAPLEQLAQGLTGRNTEGTEWRLVLGAALLAGGALLAMLGVMRRG